MKPTKPPQGPPTGHGHHYSAEELHNEGVAHEHSDINVRGIVGFLIGLGAVVSVASVLMWGLFVFFERQAGANDPQVSPLAARPVDMPRTTTVSPSFGTAPRPQLLTNEPAVLRQLRESEAQSLDQYGWIDEKAGVARVPIAEAKKLLIERGLPARSEGRVDSGLGTVKSSHGEASSGRAIVAQQPPAAADPGTAKEQGQASRPGGR